MDDRTYDPTTGTFLTPDPIDGQPGTPDEANPYDYVGNDPLNFTDPLGLSRISDCSDLRAEPCKFIVNDFQSAGWTAGENPGDTGGGWDLCYDPGDYSEEGYQQAVAHGLDPRLLIGLTYLEMNNCRKHGVVPRNPFTDLVNSVGGALGVPGTGGGSAGPYNRPSGVSHLIGQGAFEYAYATYGDSGSYDAYLAAEGLSAIRSIYVELMAGPEFRHYTEIPLSSLQRRYNESDSSLFYFKSAVFYAGWGSEPRARMETVLRSTPSQLRSGIHPGVANQFDNNRCFGNRLTQEFHGVATGITMGLGGFASEVLEEQISGAAFGPCG